MFAIGSPLEVEGGQVMRLAAVVVAALWAPPVSNFHVTSVECYMPDPGFSAATACASPPAVGSYTPFASDATQGLCFPASSYLPNSGTPALAVQGVSF
jgi:hypothetical protein